MGRGEGGLEKVKRGERGKRAGGEEEEEEGMKGLFITLREEDANERGGSGVEIVRVVGA